MSGTEVFRLLPFLGSITEQPKFSPIKPNLTGPSPSKNSNPSFHPIPLSIPSHICPPSRRSPPGTSAHRRPLVPAPRRSPAQRQASGSLPPRVHVCHSGHQHPPQCPSQATFGARPPAPVPHPAPASPTRLLSAPPSSGQPPKCSCAPVFFFLHHESSVPSVSTGTEPN